MWLIPLIIIGIIALAIFIVLGPVYSGFEGQKYGSVAVKFRKIDDTMPIITSSINGLVIPDSESYSSLIHGMDFSREYKQEITPLNHYLVNQNGVSNLI